MAVGIAMYVLILQVPERQSLSFIASVQRYPMNECQSKEKKIKRGPFKNHFSSPVFVYFLGL